MRLNYSIEIDAPIERVFTALVDDSLNKQWIPNLSETEFIEETENKVGSTFREVYHEKGKDIEMQGVITAHEPNHHHACEMSGNEFDLAVQYYLSQNGSSTLLRQKTQITFHSAITRIIMVALYPFMMWFGKRQLKSSLGKLKQLCEQGAENTIASS